MATMTCPQCNGAKKVPVDLGKPNGTKRPCYYCGGTGKVEKTKQS